MSASGMRQRRQLATPADLFINAAQRGSIV
jgi:hypothetical protein